MESWVERGTGSLVLVCEINHERYALPLQDVVEVVQAVALSPLPGAPGLVEGIVNYRGRAVPSIELRARFAKSRCTVLPSDLMVFARCGSKVDRNGVAGEPTLVALRVAGKVEVVSIDHSKVANIETLRGAASGIAGVLPMKDGMLLICDLSVFLEATERDGLEEALNRLSLPAESAEAHA